MKHNIKESNDAEENAMPEFSKFAEQAMDTMVTKTGTTIVGIKSADCVVLCADTRATSGPFVADKSCFKLHYISDDIYCAGAGTAADTDRVTEYASSMVRIFEKKYLKKAPVKYVISVISKYLFRYRGFISAALIVGGHYRGSFFLCTISPNGAVLPGFYLSQGSGGLAAISILEAGFKLDLGVEEIKALAARAIKAGILNDLYSGSNVDMVIIDKEKATVVRNYLTVATKMEGRKIVYPLDSIKITKEEVLKFTEEVSN